MARPEWWELYDHDAIDLPEPVDLDSLDPHSMRIRQGIQADTIGFTEDQCRNARHGYYANTSYIDRWLGRMVRVLEETGKLDNTVVIATSDHGDMLGERGLWFKMNFFERSLRVPFIMAGPGIANTAVPNACSLLDLAPTLLDIAADGGTRVESATPLAGRSLWESGHWRPSDPIDEAIAEYTAEMTSYPMFMIRRGRYKYIHCDTDPALLYDTDADPQEQTNLADDPGPRGAWPQTSPLRWPSAGTAMPSETKCWPPSDPGDCYRPPRATAEPHFVGLLPNPRRRQSVRSRPH